METPPKEKNLEVGSFTLQTTRGLLRDRGPRRMLMAGAVLVSLALMVCGSSLIDSLLDPHEHPTRFIVFWLACGWVTILALLLAVFDILMVRKEGRALRENLQRQASAETNIVSPSEAGGE